MPEEQAFAVLVKMCFEYGVRDLFKQGFEELHLKFYQLERLMEVKKHHTEGGKCYWPRALNGPQLAPTCILGPIHTDKSICKHKNLIYI